MDPELIAAASTIATVTLTEMVSFVREQAGLLLQRHRARAVAASAPEVLDGTLSVDDLDEIALADNEARLRQLWYRLGPQPGETDPTEEETRAGVDALRETLESVLRQHITFVGEARPPTGTPAISSRTRGSRITVTGHRNVVIGGDNRGAITVG